MSALVNTALIPPGAPQGPAGAPAPQRGARTGDAGRSFADELAQAGRSPQATGSSQSSPATQAGGLQFSRHALERVQRRGITLDSSTLARLSQGVGRAAGKGSRDSVVLVDGTAFVVSVNNRTVITAVGSEHMREHVFTNIDSAVIA